MNTSRRSLLKIMGLAPVAAPLAAKVAADAEITKLAGMAQAVAPASAFSNFGSPPGPIGDYNDARVAAHEYSKLMGLPDFVREQFRRNSLYVHALDPDIAAKKSWSMSVKILTQRERNLERTIEALEHGAWIARASTAFKKVTGWDWPW